VENPEAGRKKKDILSLSNQGKSGYVRVLEKKIPLPRIWEQKDKKKHRVWERESPASLICTGEKKKSESIKKGTFGSCRKVRGPIFVIKGRKKGATQSLADIKKGAGRSHQQKENNLYTGRKKSLAASPLTKEKKEYPHSSK